MAATFAGKTSVKLGRVNSTGNLPVDDEYLASRGWRLVMRDEITTMQATGRRVILAIPRFNHGVASVVPQIMRLRTAWDEKTLDLVYDKKSSAKALVWAKYVNREGEVLEEASAFYLRAVARGMRFYPDEWV